MSRDERVDELIIRFEEAADGNAPVAPHELCRECPELLPDLERKLNMIGAINARLAGASGGPAGGEHQPKDGRYHQLDPYAAGGMGVVYTATDKEVGRKVALKFLKGAAGKAARERFLKEAEVTGRLEHPGVVPVYGIGRDTAGRPYYAMRFISEPTLGEEIRGYHSAPANGPDRAVEFRRLLRAFGAACETVAYAHARGVIHRDIKPGNIMLGPFGETLLVDWGLAKRVDVPDPEAAVAPGMEPLKPEPGAGSVLGGPKGTYAYMSPEQAREDTQHIVPASDVFGLGATLYAVLTGRAPYEGAGALARAQEVRFAAPRRVRGDVPRPLEAICLKAMAARPEDRYAGAKELAADIDRWLADEPVSAWREPLLWRARRWAKRRRTLLAGTAAALVVATAVAAGAAFVIAGKNAKLEAANRDLGTALEVNRDDLYVASVGLAHREWLGGNLGGAQDTLASCPPERRGWEWHYLDRLTRTHLMAFPIPTGTDPVALSRDGQRLAVHDADRNRVRVWNLATGVELTLPRVTCAGPALALSPDGNLLAVRGGDDRKVDLQVWDLEAGKLLWNAAVDGAGAATFAGGRLAVHSLGSGTVFVYHARTGNLEHGVDIPGGRNAAAFQLALSPDGALLAVTNWGESVVVFKVATGKRVLELDGHAFGAAFSPDGKQIVTAATEARVWDVATGELLFRLHGHVGPIGGLAYSPDGRHIATGGWDQTARVWDARTGRAVRTVRGHTSIVSAVAFGTDDRLVTVGGDGRTKTWDVTTDQEARTIEVPPAAGGLSALTLSADGTRLAGATGSKAGFEIGDSVVRVWDADSGAEVVAIPQPKCRIHNLVFSPDGRQLAGTCWCHKKNELKLWDAGTGRELFAFGLDGGGRSVTFSPDGRHVAAASGPVRVWDLTAGTLAAETGIFGGEGFIWVAPEPGGGRLLVGDWWGRIRPWDWRKQESLAPTQEGGTTVAISNVPAAFSPDGRRVAFTENFVMGRLNVVETVSLDQKDPKRLSWHGHPRTIESLCFNTDGGRLATASFDGTVKLWDARTGKELLTLRGQDPFSNLVTFSADGRRLAASSYSLSPGVPNKITIWTATPGP